MPSLRPCGLAWKLPQLSNNTYGNHKNVIGVFRYALSGAPPEGAFLFLRTQRVLPIVLPVGHPKARYTARYSNFGIVTYSSHYCFKPQQRQCSPWLQVVRDIVAIAPEGATR